MTHLSKTDLEKIHALELNVMRTVDQICRKHNISYFALGGTLIGAVRHKGFIPWDDDIDIAMSRRDYKKFLKIAPNLLPNNIKIIDGSTNPHSDFLETRVFDANTIFANHLLEKIFPDAQRGFGVDILIIDGTPSNPKRQKPFFRRIMFWRKLVMFWRHGAIPINTLKHNRTSTKGIIMNILSKALRLCVNEKTLLNHLEKTASKYPFNPNKTPNYLLSYETRYIKHDTKCIQTTQDLPFEGLKISAPIDYDGFLLECHFDDYMKLPPKNKRYAHVSDDTIIKI